MLRYVFSQNKVYTHTYICFMIFSIGLPKWCGATTTKKVDEQDEEGEVVNVERQFERWPKSNRNYLLKMIEKEMRKEGYAPFYGEKHLNVLKRLFDRYKLLVHV